MATAATAATFVVLTLTILQPLAYAKGGRRLSQDTIIAPVQSAFEQALSLRDYDVTAAVEDVRGRFKDIKVSAVVWDSGLQAAKKLNTGSFSGSVRRASGTNLDYVLMTQPATDGPISSASQIDSIVRNCFQKVQAPADQLTSNLVDCAWYNLNQPPAVVAVAFKKGSAAPEDDLSDRVWGNKNLYWSDPAALVACYVLPAE